MGGRALSGHAGFGARLRTADTTDAVFGNGLVNSRWSEIHLVIRTHGPTIPHMVDQQIHTFNGGCEDDEPNRGLCQDVQFAAFAQDQQCQARAERGHTEGLLVGCLC